MQQDRPDNAENPDKRDFDLEKARVKDSPVLYHHVNEKISTTGVEGISSIRLGREEAKELIDDYRDRGNAQALEKLIVALQPLVNYFVFKSHIPQDLQKDAQQAAVLGIIRAVERYDCMQEKASFTTYASYWIQFGIRNEAANRSIVKVPSKYIKKLESIVAQAQANLDAASEEDHQEAQSNLSIAKVRLELLRETAFGRSSEHAEDLQPVKDEENDFDLVALSACINRLPPQYRLLVKARYGINSDEGKGLKLRELGEKMGKTGERVRQMQNEALRLLRVMLANDGYSSLEDVRE